MRIAITGSSGLIGSILIPALGAAGHEVTRVVRGEGSGGAEGGGAASGGAASGGARVVVWDPAAGKIDAAGLEGHDVVIHLAGASLLGRWTEKRKEQIVSSRVGGTRLLCETVARLERPPRVLLAASAVGYYGNRRPLDVVDEGSAPGMGFLARTVIAWESATNPAAEAGVRVVNMRFGVVLSAAGGMLRAVLPVFRAGLGARLGSGRQIMSWIAGSELPFVVEHLLRREELAGPVNIVSPSPVSNTEFTAVLARVVQRPAFLRAPAWVLERVAGELAREMLLGGANVRPRRLEDSGYRFRYPELEVALRHELGAASVARRAPAP
jgi:uncharacterized protein (TIGR01777 family)